ncbi:metalloregulator ArsR/SmtB family transcription factor [Nocardia arthritidis]|uniref:Metalloregulator ArsR/SmtB family transcription factor n=1 Tax=Nocardia arthritidis TaxID=228602 RepID=A0A6G9YIU3_9NOCA|nr:metalloregulator ArsR/SmtB family transcription factor [Nocardia arthritidis]
MPYCVRLTGRWSNDHTISVATNGVRALEALSDPTRRAIFEALPQAPRSVGELAATVGVSSSAVSQHLRVLREARLVGMRPDGNRRLYHLDPRGLGAARDYLEQFWPSAIAAYSAALSAARIDDVDRTGDAGPQPTRR